MDLSLIVPTRNRRQSLQRTLNAIAAQNYPRGRFEVIVADDGSIDRTAEWLRSGETPLPIRTVSFARSRGAAAARNLGAAAAVGRVLVFIDDDVEASPHLVRSHLEAHDSGANVTIGYLKTDAAHAHGFFRIALSDWWDAMFEEMRRPGYRFGFRDLLTGNCAIDSCVFRKAGGFDEQLECHEDYELGIRLIEAGAEVRFVEKASAVHHECSTLERSLARKVAEGRADVHIVRKHPQLISEVPLGRFDDYASSTDRRLRELTFKRPAIARAVTNAQMRSLGLFEAVRMRGRWYKALYTVLTHSYWCGVVEELHTFSAFRSLVEASYGRPPGYERLHVNLGERSLADLMAMTDERRPHSVFISYFGTAVGEIPPVPGAERLRGVHLRASLATNLARRLLAAVGTGGVVPTDALPL